MLFWKEKKKPEASPLAAYLDSRAFEPCEPCEHGAGGGCQLWISRSEIRPPSVISSIPSASGRKDVC